MFLRVAKSIEGLNVVVFHFLLPGNRFQGVAEGSQGSPYVEPGFIPNFSVEFIDHVSEISLPWSLILIIRNEFGCCFLPVSLGPGSFRQFFLFLLDPKGNFSFQLLFLFLSDLFFLFSQDSQPGFLAFLLFLFLCFVSEPVKDGTPGLTTVPGVLRLVDVLKSAVALSAIMVLSDSFSQLYTGELGQMEGSDRDIRILVLVHFNRDPGIIGIDCLVFVRVHPGHEGF